ncbi:MAG: hypothetical protein ACYCT2_06575 [Thermoplasmataceae archaeon]
MEELVELTPQQAYQRRLIQKSHDYDKLEQMYDAKREEFDRPKQQIVSAGPKEILLSEPELKTYRFLQTLTNNDEGIELL